MVAAKGAKEGDNGWMKGLEGIGGLLKRMPGVTIYQVRPHPDVHPATAVPDATDGRGGAVEHIRDHLPLLRVQRVEHRHRRRRRRRRFSRRLIRREPKPDQRVLHPRLEGLGYLP